MLVQANVRDEECMHRIPMYDLKENEKDDLHFYKSLGYELIGPNVVIKNRYCRQV